MALNIKERLSKIKIGKKSRDKAAASPRGMEFKPSKGAKFVIFIGDEGAILIYIKGSAVQSRQFVPDNGLQSLSEFRQTLSRDPEAPILLVIDSMDQSYVQQTLPPVSSLSVGKLVKRRLERDFASSDIKGAIMLGREQTGRKDWNFMMVAVEKSPQLTVWINFIEEQPNHFRGIYLVSVETENIVKYLEHASVDPREGPPTQWKFFVSHNKVGGFRQVILRNGRIIFTRLAQPIGESNTEMVAGNIEQEMISTIEYMKRLSFNAQDGLDIYIVASAGIKSAIDKTKFGAASLHVFTPYEMAQHFGIEGATQPTDQFGDVILAATIGCSRKYVLPLSTPLSKQVNQYFQLLSLQRTIAIIGGLGIIGYAGAVGIGMISLVQDAGEMETNMQTQRSKIGSLREEINKSDLDIEKANDLLDLYKQMLEEQISPIPFVQALMPIKQSPVWVKEITWEAGDSTKSGNANLLLTSPKAHKINASANLEFLDVTADPKGFRIISQKVLENIREWFKGYKVEYSSLPEGYMEDNKLEIKFDDEEKNTAAAAASGPPEARVSIIQNDAPVAGVAGNVPSPTGAMSPPSPFKRPAP